MRPIPPAPAIAFAHGESGDRSWGPQGALSLLILTLAVAVLLYRLAYLGGVETTALMYVGIPTVLALILVRTPPPRTVTGSILKALTLALLISGIFLGEGFVCVLMVAPVLLGIGVAIGLIVDRGKAIGSDRMRVIVVLLVAGPLSLEGVTPSLSFNRDERVTVEKVLHATPDEVLRRLAGPMDLSRPLPWFQRLGFPTPVEASGSGVHIGASREVGFRSGDHEITSMRFVVVGHGPGRLVFEARDDRTPYAHWLQWRTAEVRWEQVGPSATRIAWTLEYRRGMDPAWYFGPLERYGVRHAASYLIDAAATP